MAKEPGLAFPPPALYLGLTSVLVLVASLIWGCAEVPEKTLNWQQENGYRWSKLVVESGQVVGFEEQTGAVPFVNNITEEDISENRHYLNGSGVALGDVDGDGFTDIYLGQLNGPNKLYKNLGGFEFVDITDSAGVAHEGYFTTGVTFADVDADGDPDLLITSMSQDNVLYINDSNGHFNLKKDSGLEQSKGSHTMALADIDSDGDLDLYVANYKSRSVLDLFDVSQLTWEKTVREEFRQDADQTYTLVPPYDEHYGIIYKEEGIPERREIGREDELYLNNGDGSFKKVNNLEQRFLDSEGNPQGLEPDFGLAAKFHDLNGDGLPDLYVCNDYWTKDRIWINRGEGIFSELDPLAIRNMSFSAMAVDFADINRDGFSDIFVTEMLSQTHEGRLRQYTPEDPYPAIPGRYDDQPQYNRNSLYLNRGDGTFAETSYFSGLEASGWSWASIFLDVDLDGFEDLLITTGYSFDVQDLDAQNEWREDMARRTRQGDDIHIFPPLELPNKIFRNQGDNTFADLSEGWGFSGQDIAQGMALADLDQDGDLDVVMNRLNKQAGVYENRATKPRIAVKLEGQAPNTEAIGAIVELKGGPIAQHKEVSTTGDYLSSSSSLLSFAGDAANTNHKIKVSWPGGSVTTIDSVQVNRIYEIQEPANNSTIIKDEAVVRQETERDSITPIFRDVSASIDHSHNEAYYDDYRIQPLLPKKLSQLGPGISWLDYDGDGDDDLFIGTGREGSIAVYENQGSGRFASRSFPSLTDISPGDKTAILGLGSEDDYTLMVGNANYEPGDINLPSVLGFSIQNNLAAQSSNISGIFSTTGPLAAADYDSDGDLDLFVGGRFVPAHYPMNATSRIFRNEGGSFVLDEQNSRKFQGLGLVTGALFFDYEQDGDQDLLLSLEWGPIKLFRNQNGNLQDISESTGLSGHLGWWNGVATGDFNNDGRLDIVATNQGRNTSYQLDSDEPLRIYYQDLNFDGRVDIIESYYNSVAEGYVPRRQMAEYQSISSAFNSGLGGNEAFANTTVDELLQQNADRMPYKEINTLDHTLFINEGDRFTAHSLPPEAQYSTAFYAGAADYNNDGNEDLFLTQNFFDMRQNTPRADAGRGLLLEGDGTGSFKTVPGHVSGIKVYGDQRGAGLSDFDRDGRVDIAISQNAAETKLYRNSTAKPGMVIELSGPASNPQAIGASIRLVYADGSKGPRRIIQAGSGYWSQNSAIQVLGTDGYAEVLEVHWPDGLLNKFELTDVDSTFKFIYE